jgi:hypothetical protein
MCTRLLPCCRYSASSCDTLAVLLADISGLDVLIVRRFTDFRRNHARQIKIILARSQVWLHSLSSSGGGLFPEMLEPDLTLLTAV